MTLKFEVNWNKDADYSDVGENVTAFVRGRSGISFTYGRDQSTALAPTVSGSGQFTLDNTDRRFSPRNTSSPLYPNIKPARPVKVTRTISGTDYILFVGHTDDSPINPEVSSKTVNLSLVDSLADFRGLTISTALYSGIRTGEAIGYILDAVGWTGTRDLDSGATVFPWWWEDGTDALDALEKVVRCEGPPALLTIGSDGAVVFKDRHHRLLDAASITSQGTWRDSQGVTPYFTPPFTYDDGWRNIINHGLIPVDVRTLRESQAIWTGDSYIKWSASETKTFIINTSDPFQDAIAPVVDTDYTVDAGAFSSVTLSRTSGASTTLTMTATGAGARIRNLQVRGRPVQTAYTQQITASNSSSITSYGQRSFPGDLPFCNIYDAQAVLDTAIELRAEPLPIVTAKFVIPTGVTWAAQILARDLSDRVTIVETQTSLNDDFYVESITHELTSELDHVVTIGCELVPPAGAVTASNIFILGSAVSGHRLGTGVLAS